MLEHIYVVVGSGSSDIGKGWLTASIASVLPNALPVKIDPFLNRQFPPEIGTKSEGKVVSDDFATYRSLDLPVHPEQNILGGALLSEFFQQPYKMLSRGATKKLVFTDVSEFLAEKIFALIEYREYCQNMVIEVGGIVTDLEHVYIPTAIRMLGLKTGVIPEIVVLSYFEYAEFGFPLKTHHIRNGVREVRKRFSLPLKACFVRRRYVPETISDLQIKEELTNIAFETQLSPSQLIYEPNVPNVKDLKDVVAATGLFKNKQGVCLVSACLLGTPCRYNGTTEAFDHQTISLFKQQGVLTICPELLGGLSVPRESCEIIGGDGFDVLDGKAKVMSESGDDCTHQFINGAQRALDIAKRMNVKEAILYYRSPSCGCSQIYDGSFTGQLKPGHGVFGALLGRHGIQCVPNTTIMSTKNTKG